MEHARNLVLAASMACNDTSIPVVLLEELSKKKIERLAFLADIAEALLIEGITQQEAAERFNLSRPSISRLLTEAREMGIVNVEIRRVLQNHDDLAAALMAKFPLQSAHVGGVSNKRHHSSREQYVHFAVERVRDALFPGAIVGITLGRTLGQIVAELATREPMNISLVQLCGSLGSTDDFLDSHALVETLGNAYRAKCSYLHAPYTVETEAVCHLLNDNASNRLAIALGRSADIALFGVGSVDERQASLVLGGHVDRKLLRKLESRGAVGDVAGYYLNASGELVETGDLDYWKTGLSFEEFRGIKHRIAVAVGEHKLRPLNVTLSSGLISELITDDQTAEALLAN